MHNGAVLKNGEIHCDNNNAENFCHSEHKNYLFCPNILKTITFSDNEISKFQPTITPQHPGDGLLVRPLLIDDYEKGYLQLLAQLTTVGQVSQADFEATFRKMKDAKNTYFVVVVEDLNKGSVIGCCTLLLEQKFIHDAGVRGRIEDVVVDDGYRGKQLGKLLVETCTQLGRQYFLCYKMSLDCKDKLVDFYGSFGYKKEPSVNTLIQRFGN